ncbi:MAG: hypothetical protein H7330_06875, partial [Hymenobacteraceae bacterium]|nr:hypothetical protein [Hymenobacteraceae bacterium]
MSAQLRRLILPFLFVLAVVPALGQAYSTSTKQTRRIYTDKANGFTLDADIDFRDGRASNPNKVKVKYTYNGPLLIEDRYAVWKMRYIDGADQLQERQFSAPVGGTEIRGVLTDAPVHQTSVIDEPFDCKQIVSICFDLETSRTAKTGVFASTQSIAPDSVSGPRALLPGQQVTLTVMGGALARGGAWVWYEGTCGGSRVGTGRSLTLTPTANTTYYVRAEPQMGTGACLAATVRVDDRSVAPVTITGASQACAGESLTLQVAGGGLGLDARWVWY